MTKIISIAYSPDTDDAFMVQALRSGQVNTGSYRFRFTAADIQELNALARQGVYDITAISIAAYPSLAKDYMLMPIGASIGDEFGPAIIVRPDSEITSVNELVGRRIAVPGLQTSAYFASRGLIGEFTAVPMSFLAIGEAVKNGDVAAGVLIHELQLDCEQRGFRKLADLGRLWSSRYNLPLPLGANAIKRDLGPQVIAEVTQILRDSIEFGLANRLATLKEALRSSKADIDLNAGDQYISMYVNHRSLAMQADVRAAMQQLFTIGEQTGLCPQVSLGEALYE
jgi:1,4-dihydroxy-6-naphthoate synthase